MRVLFYGTPAVAVPFLESLAALHEVAGVVTRQDKPAGRGLTLAPPPVKVKADALGLKVFQPNKPAEILADLRALDADVAVAVAYGRLLPPPVIEAARLGTLNVHFSLLPKYRGAAPIQRSLMDGVTRSGVSVFWIDAGMDTGPVFLTKELDVGVTDDAETLEARLAALGVEALRETLGEIAAGRIRKEPQVGEPSLAPPLKPEEGRLDLSQPAAKVHDRVRALRRGPVAFLELDRGGRKARLNVLKTLPPEAGSGPVRSVVAVERGRGVLIQCGVGRVWLQRVQPEGKKPMDAADFLNGWRLKAGDPL